MWAAVNLPLLMEKLRLRRCWSIRSNTESPLLFENIHYFPSLSFYFSLSVHAVFFCPPQAAFRTDLTVLLDQIGAGKESLSFMKRRIRRLAPQWATAANRLDIRLGERWRDQKKVRHRAVV